MPLSAVVAFIGMAEAFLSVSGDSAGSLVPAVVKPVIADS